MTQEKLAEIADVDRTYPSLLERGLRQPTLAYLFALADALKEDPADLVRRTYTELCEDPATATQVTALGTPVSQEADRDTPARLPFRIESGRQRR